MTFKLAANELLETLPNGTTELSLADIYYPITYTVSGTAYTIQTAAGSKVYFDGTNHVLVDTATGIQVAKFKAADLLFDAKGDSLASAPSFNGVTGNKTSKRPALTGNKTHIVPASCFFPPYIAGKTYHKGEHVCYNGQVYVCKNATTGSKTSPRFSTTAWTLVATFTDALLATLAPAFLETSTYAVGDFVTHNGSLYVCSVAVETAGEWTGDTNWTLTNVVSATRGALSGETMPDEPTSSELLAAVKRIFTALGGVIQAQA